MGLSKKKVALLKEFVGWKYESCPKHEDEVGTLEPHKINPELSYILLNIKMCCSACHEKFNSAQRIANGLQG